jgi:hypothetical protein
MRNLKYLILQITTFKIFRCAAPSIGFLNQFLQIFRSDAAGNSNPAAAYRFIYRKNCIIIENGAATPLKLRRHAENAGILVVKLLE